MVRISNNDVASLLATGGDDRIIPDAKGRNRYGLGILPEPDVPAFASSTGSAISREGFAVAETLWSRVGGALDASIYAREMETIRAGLCEGFGLNGHDLIFAESGTTAHAIAAQLAKAASPQPLSAVLMTPAETGRGVPAALEGRYYCEHLPLGDTATMGALWDEPAIPIIAIAIRDDAGMPRDTAAIKRDTETAIRTAIDRGDRVLLNTIDGSKTGLIAPDIQSVVALQWKFGDHLDILVDACQFRNTPASLRAYLAQGWAVALTGSKFYGSPIFSGVIVVPPTLAEKWHHVAPSPALRGFSAQGDWPSGWVAKTLMPDVPNFGLLLRWRAALTEMQAFLALPEDKVTGFFNLFSDAVMGRFAQDDAFMPVPVVSLDRAPFAVGSWDKHQTIFPFLLRRNGGWLNREETRAIYATAQTLDKPIRIGQPVDCGIRDGIPVSALRLCLSSRLAVDATTGRGADLVIAEGLSALDRLAALVSQLGNS